MSVLMIRHAPNIAVPYMNQTENVLRELMYVCALELVNILQPFG